ncbi:metal transporter (plasmid) [Rhizorhabdus wittichii DC-6]|nr:metal transporter [Rhizorhabdus wittichii DC-6]
MRAFIGRLPRRVVSGMMVATSVAALCGPAQAQVAPPFATLLRQTADAPRRVESEAEVRRSEGLARQARARPNPTIGVLTENIAGSSPYRGFDRAETTLQYSQPLEIGGKRSARVAAGEAGVVASRARDRDAQIRYAYDLARAYAAAEVADQRISLAEGEVEQAQNILRAARALVDAGKEARLRALQAEAALNAVSADLEAAKADRIAAYARLSALAGVEETFTGLSESLLTTPVTAPAYGPVDPMANSSYLAAQAEREAAERRLSAEQKRAIPDVTAIVGVRRLDYENATALTAGVSIPLNIFDRNRGNIAASQAEAQAAAARLAMARNDAIAEARAAQAQIAAAQSRVAAAEASQGTAEETYRLARIAYEAGKSPLVELLNARHGLGEARGIVLDARVARFEARAQLARLQGRTLSGDEIQ